MHCQGTDRCSGLEFESCSLGSVSVGQRCADRLECPIGWHLHRRYPVAAEWPRCPGPADQRAGQATARALANRRWSRGHADVATAADDRWFTGGGTCWGKFKEGSWNARTDRGMKQTLSWCHRMEAIPPTHWAILLIGFCCYWSIPIYLLKSINVDFTVVLPSKWHILLICSCLILDLDQIFISTPMRKSCPVSNYNLQHIPLEQS